MELVYAQVFTGENRVLAWSSLRGPLDVKGAPWRHMFLAPDMKAAENPARVMIHFLGDYENISEDEQLYLMDCARKAGYGVTRFENGEPILEPEEAYGLLLVPFT